MLAKSNKIELSEEFMVIKEKNRPSVMLSLHPDKNEKECQINFRYFQTDIFE